MHSNNLKDSEKVMNQFVVRFFRNSGNALASFLEGTPITPNALSIIGFLFVIAASFLLAKGNYALSLTASALLFLSIIIDFADGSLARKKGLVSEFGDWFDAMIDEAREFLVILALAWGLAGDQHETRIIWVLAFFILGADALTMRAVTKFYNKVDSNAHMEEMKNAVQKNLFFGVIKELISVRLLRYVFFPIFALFGALFLYLAVFAFYGVVVCLGFLLYCGLALYRRNKTL
jgi:phosphatidylglycerophosphate synthase